MRNTPTKTSRRQDIIHCAIKLFAESGFHNTPVQAIADAAGINKATLYYHIGSKENLLYLMHRDVIDDFIADLEVICSRAELTSTQQLQLAISVHIQHVVRRQPEVKIFFRERDSVSPEIRARIAERREHYQNLIVSIIEQGVKRGEFREVNAKLTAFFIIGMCNWVYQWYSAEGPLSSEVIYQLATEFVLSGLAKGSPCQSKQTSVSGEKPKNELEALKLIDPVG